jgi:fibrillarin-like pre-rRNA processing protein
MAPYSNYKYINFQGSIHLATNGPPVYGETTKDGWRFWDYHRSKLGYIIGQGIEVGLKPGSKVLYLGAANGTTVSHVADIASIVYAVEISPQPMRDLINVASSRKNIIPLLKDARISKTYSHVVESNIDLIVQDVAARGQVKIALENKKFLSASGKLFLTIKSRSENATTNPKIIFKNAIDELSTGYNILETHKLSSHHRDHLAIIAEPLF